MRQTVVLGSKVKSAIRAARKNPRYGHKTFDDAIADFSRQTGASPEQAERALAELVVPRPRRPRPTQAEVSSALRAVGITEEQFAAAMAPKRKNPMSKAMREKLGAYGVPEREIDMISDLPRDERVAAYFRMSRAFHRSKALTRRAITRAEREAHREARKLERKRSNMARRKSRKNPRKISVRALKKAMKRSNPGHYYARRNPKAPKKTAAQRYEEQKAAAAKLGLTPEVIAQLQAAGIIKTPRAVKAKMTEAEKKAAKEARKAARAEEREARGSAAGRAAAGYYLGQLSKAEFRELMDAGTKGQRKSLEGFQKWIEAGKFASSKRAERMGLTAHVAAYSARKRKKGEPVLNKHKIARAFIALKKAQHEGIDAQSKSLAKTLGLSRLPNPGMKGFVDHLKGSIPMAALAVGGVAVVGWGVALTGLVPMIKEKYPTASKYAVPVTALGVGIIGSYALKMYPKTAKYSGMMLAGGAAIAGVAILNTAWGSDGKSLASKISDKLPGILSMGDYHMGMHVGDYHMGGEAARLNVGDYHMGQIDVVTDRRMLAPPGEPMPRHDTRRDNVDESISTFTGSLAGDIFDA